MTHAMLRAFRPLGASALALAAVLGLCGGTCHVSYSSDHDCKDPRRDHGGCQHHGTHGGPTDPGSAVLQGYQVEPAREPLVHPVRALEGVRGARLGSGRRDAADVERFGRELVAANPQLLGLPAGAGRWAFAGARATAHGGLEGLWRQRAALGGPGELALPGTWLLLRFDPGGALRAVEQRSYLSPAFGVALLGATAPEGPRAWDTR